MNAKLPVGNIAKLMSLSEIFNDRYFVIPDYQRSYAWEAKQVTALLEDIEQLFQTEHIHYTGTLVINKSDPTRHTLPVNNNVFDIIDGQQRITSISILISILHSKLENEVDKLEFMQNFLIRGTEGNGCKVLTLNKTVNKYFDDVVINHKKGSTTEEYISQVNIKTAYELMSTWVESQNQKSALDILGIITDKLGFIVYEPDSHAESGMMFEVINNRGRALTELEKVKNYLIYYSIKKQASQLRSKVDESWSEILKNLASAHQLSKPDEKLFLRSVVVCYFGLNKDQSSDIYSNIKKKFPISGKSKWKKLSEFVEFLVSCSRYYDCLLNEHSIVRQELSKINKKATEQIELIRSQTTFANILPIYFALMSHRNTLSDAELTDSLRVLETLNFRIYMTRNGAKRIDSGQGSLFWIANKFYKGHKDDNWMGELNSEVEDYQYNSSIGSLIGKLCNVVDDYNNIVKFESGLVLKKEDNDDFYSWRSIKYFLMNFEREINTKRTIKVEHILKKRESNKTNDYFSIEHIWATANEIKGPKINGDESSFHKRRLGNFMLLELGINIQATKSDILEKIETYKGKNNSDDFSILKQTSLLIKDFDSQKKQLDLEYKDKARSYTGKYHRKLNQGTINLFEKRLVKFALSRWDTKWAEKYWTRAE